MRIQGQMVSAADQNLRRLSDFQGLRMGISIHRELVVCTPGRAGWWHSGIVPAEASGEPVSVPSPAAARLDAPIDVRGKEKDQDQAYLGGDESRQFLRRGPLTQPRAFHIG